jgi:murein DD-endopeptidase MepM/ murein hydrolase activator NlpD
MKSSYPTSSSTIHYKGRSVQDKAAANNADLTLRLGHLQSQAAELEQRGRELNNKRNKSNEVDFSISWGKAIAEKATPHQPSSWLSELPSSSTLLPAKSQPLTTISEELLLEPYREETQWLPEGWPLKVGRVSSVFGWRGKRMHKGIDLAIEPGTPIYAVADGIVQRAGRVRGYGKMVEIKHSDMYSTRYGHNSENFVKAGDFVRKGQVIALVGNTGRSTGPHLHFEVRQDGTAINPVMYLGTIGQFNLAESVRLSEHVSLLSNH